LQHFFFICNITIKQDYLEAGKDGCNNGKDFLLTEYICNLIEQLARCHRSLAADPTVKRQKDAAARKSSSRVDGGGITAT
jgi:hypothetical protein